VEPEIAFGRVLRRIRKNRGLSQENLAFDSGLQRNFISLLELGERSPTLRSLFKISAALDVSPSKILALTEAELAGESSAADQD
jgi:transcriptional regulator with XRE-family HTH domain